METALFFKETSGPQLLGLVKKAKALGLELKPGNWSELPYAIAYHGQTIFSTDHPGNVHSFLCGFEQATHINKV